MLNILDLKSSSIGWVLKSGTLGLFKISSSLKLKKLKKKYYLAETVLAGNVFSKDRLPKTPHFFFQWCTNGNNRKVFCVSQNRKVSGHSKKNIVKKFLLNLNFIKLKELSIDNLFNNLKLLNKSLTCRIIYKNQLCEFLVNHININNKKKQFQIETGPVLLKKNRKIIPAFIFINSIDECQIVWNYPSLVGAMEKINIKLKLFINA
jgi:hypothetical protein